MTDTTSYIEEACTLAVTGWTIPAALTMPAQRPAGAPPPSAILLVPGSLFSDVNGDYPTWNSFPHTYAHLARQLSARGHAVYRFAKLGPGTGSVPTDPKLSATLRNWDGRLTIAEAALDAMQRELDARDVTAERIIAAGHSEGSVVVSRLAVSDRASDLDGIILLSGPSVGILEIMREQVGFGLQRDQVDDARRRLGEAIELVRRGEPIPQALVQGPGMGIGALASMPEEGRRYMRDVDATDPIHLAREMKQPVLIVQGGKDTSVPTHHAEALRAALLARESGEARTTYEFVPDVSHMYKVVPPHISGPEAFGYPGETDARVVDAIDRWVRALVP